MGLSCPQTSLAWPRCPRACRAPGVSQALDGPEVGSATAGDRPDPGAVGPPSCVTLAGSGQMGSQLGFQQLSRASSPGAQGAPASDAGARERVSHRVCRCHLSRAHSAPLTREQDVERPFLVGATPPPRPPLVSGRPGRPSGFLRPREGRVCAVEARTAASVRLRLPPVSDRPPFPDRLAQLDIDSHLAQCLADSTEDVAW